MNMIQILGIFILGIFYLAYFGKMLGQRKKGIQTNQLGVGKKKRRTMFTERLLRIITTVIVLVIIVSIYLNTTFISNRIVRYLGILLIGIGTGVFIVAMITMRDSWRAGIPQGEKLQIVTKGIYRVSRNPAFLGFDLTYIGATIAFGNVALLLFSMVAIIMMHLQILEEEKYMETTFGGEYLTYKNRVGRYLLW
ncbi:Protein-S-isoprenylcysteine O-methyltransferase Ste14 [Anaerosporobacter mobilis DSM 15930]|uniref:Protein-S-isoprenylcysteine O-methyltransferase Ste14 n=1 Tax=Anaerosporobacter mobilis DSM 15930 TaxID=1120996 RepID=A0A1M7JJZ1_9FIRM|nr:isoprenylcysteine carboxylmethyltransferase family protein [Anaerosporobacter mobilis]SHM53429.1 Protein-S-isoprenylcysteine O-methyltransferase Ste14 [Anaerosporobacter mobilis DSM 15930]